MFKIIIMKSRLILLTLTILIPFLSCKHAKEKVEMKIIFFHHSTGSVIWHGKELPLITKVAKKISNKLAKIVSSNDRLPVLFEKYSLEHGKQYIIEEMEFPKSSPYGWNNFPYDYYNIWVKNAGKEPFLEEPTLEMLTKEYQVIIFKHCFPVSNIQPDKDSADINSDLKTTSNYKLQYNALKKKLHEFPDTKFIVFTGAAQVKSNISEDKANRARDFFRWVTDEWDSPDDNIYIWDLYRLQTEGGLYFKDEYAISINNSHPNSIFASMAVNLLFNRILDVIENNGSLTQLSGEKR